MFVVELVEPLLQLEVDLDDQMVWWFLLHIPDTPVIFPVRPDLRPKVSGLISGVSGTRCGMCS